MIIAPNCSPDLQCPCWPCWCRIQMHQLGTLKSMVPVVAWNGCLTWRLVMKILCCISSCLVSLYFLMLPAAELILSKLVTLKSLASCRCCVPSLAECKNTLHRFVSYVSTLWIFPTSLNLVSNNKLMSLVSLAAQNRTGISMNANEVLTILLQWRDISLKL